MLKPVIVACLIMLAPQRGLAQSKTSFVGDAGGDLDETISQIGQDYLDVNAGVGLSIGIVENGRVRFYNVGSVAKGKSRPPTEETVYEIGSIGKTFIGLLLANAIVDGKVKLEDDIGDYLAEKYDNLSYDGQCVRVVHLANMTAGIPNDLPDEASPEALPRCAAIVGDLAKRDDFFRGLHAVKLTEKPGFNPSHSNAAAQLLGYILENVYDSPLDDLIPRLIETPLKMHRGAGTTDRPRAKGHNDQGAGLAAGGTAAGLLYSTDDMVKYVAHQLDERDPAVALSHRSTWDTLDKQQSIGLFWIASKTAAGRRLRYSGGTPDFSSFCDLYPDEKLGIVLLANNSDAGAQERLQKASEKIAEAMLEMARR